ncbi:MAG: GGDEF domain-containing protein [Sulfurimonas sp.]
MLNTFFLLGMFAFLFFALLHTFITGKYFIALLDIFAFIVFLYLYFDFKKSKNIKKAALVGTVLLAVFMFTFASYNHNQSFGLIWTIFFPIFTISQFKPKTGLLVSLVYYLFLFSYLFYGALYWNESSWDKTSLLRLFIASMLLTFIYYAIERSFESTSIRLERLTNIDALTKIFNRRKIDEIMESKFYEFQRYGTNLSIAILDIDDFKHLNDTYGHSTGDTVLREFANLLAKNTRKTDFVGRWGGEEFIIIMPNASLEQARLNMQRMMQKMASHKFETVETIRCSIGIAQANKETLSVDELFRRTDNALYRAKRNGKNQILCD